MTSKEAPSGSAGREGRPPDIERKARDEIGARLRSEHADLARSPLPSKIAYLLRLLARATVGPKAGK